MNKPTISVRVHIPIEDIENLLYSASRGISYWAHEAPERPYADPKMNEISGISLLDYETEMKQFMKGELKIHIFDWEDNSKRYDLDIAKIKSGLTAMAKNERESFKDLISDNTDMYTADALIQCALFGKIIYS